MAAIYPSATIQDNVVKYVVAVDIASDYGGLLRPEMTASVRIHLEARSALAVLLAEREAVVLRFFENMSVEQTADVMGCAEGTVKATVHQALRSMRQRLQQLA